MKYTLRKSFSFHRRKGSHDIHPSIETNDSSNSNLNLVKPVKSKSFLQRRRRHSSSPSSSSDKTKSKVFEPRCDMHSNDEDDDEPFSSLTNTRTGPFDRLTYRIRQSFRNILTRQRSRLESINSKKRLIMEKNDQNQVLYPLASTGLTSPLIMSTKNNPIKCSHTNQS